MSTVAASPSPSAPAPSLPPGAPAAAAPSLGGIKGTGWSSGRQGGGGGGRRGGSGQEGENDSDESKNLQDDYAYLGAEAGTQLTIQGALSHFLLGSSDPVPLSPHDLSEIQRLMRMRASTHQATQSAAKAIDAAESSPESAATPVDLEG